MIKSGSSRPWSQTSFGNRFYFDDPREGVITIRDIARPLSRIPRFNGAGDTDVVISIAEHSIAVASVIELRYGDAALSLAALLHDASEAYMNDISTPQKSHDDMAGYRDRERVAMSAVERRFGIARGLTSDPRIKEVDLDCLATEALLTYTVLDAGWMAWIAGCVGVSHQFVYRGLPWREAEAEFLAKFRRLRGER